jgi:hypothetical protein
MPRIVGVKERSDLDLWSGWSTSPNGELCSEVSFGPSIDLFTFDISRRILCNSFGSLMPSYEGNKHTFIGASIYVSFDSQETYDMFFSSVRFTVMNGDTEIESFSPKEIIIPDIQKKVNDVPSPTFNFGICGEVMFKQSITVATHVRMTSDQPFVDRMHSIKTNGIITDRDDIEKRARISVTLFGNKVRDVQ